MIDCHSDILIPVMEGKMRLSERVEVPDPATRRPPQGMSGGIGDAFGFSAHTNYFGPMGQYDLPRLVEGGVTALPARSTSMTVTCIVPCRRDWRWCGGYTTNWRPTPTSSSSLRPRTSAAANSRARWARS